MPAQALDHTYRYAQSSSISLLGSDRPRLSLVTTQECGSNAQFFRGSVINPKRMADMILALVSVVQSRFFVPPAMLARILAMADPVITCGQSQFRFEGFSACGGAYARVDLLPNAVDGERITSGTTNVDINAPMRAALKQVREGQPMDLSVSADGLEIAKGDVVMIERKVSLPSRWVRGFTEVQASQAAMELCFELRSTDFRRFLRDIPHGLKGLNWISASGSGLRISTVPGPASVGLGGLPRLRVLEPLMRHVDSVRVYGSGRAVRGASLQGDNAASPTAWELTAPDARFLLVLSPDVWRGFSGEGQVLGALSKSGYEEAVSVVRAALRWQDALYPANIAAEFCVDQAAVEWSLAQFAASGLIGYDLHEQAYFHRELPYKQEHITRLQPRLKSARRLVDEAAVSVEPDSDPLIAWVRSGNLDYRVVLAADTSRCSCVWFAKHSQARGPCKHVLAVQMYLDKGNADADRY